MAANGKIEGPVAAQEYSRKSFIEAQNPKYLTRYIDPRFGPINIIELPGNPKKLMVREKTFSDKKELAQELLAVKKRIALSDAHLLNLVDYSTGEASKLCSTQYWIKLFFEFPDHDVEQELRRRSKSNFVGFNSSELTHMLYQTVKGGAALHKVNLYHGDITPLFIEMQNPESYKLVERFGDLAKPEEAQKSRLASGGEIYSSPEVYETIKNPKVKVSNPTQLFKNGDVFSLGMTLLHAGTDEGVQSAYSPKEGKLNLQNLDKLKADFAKKFKDNSLLVSTVLAMVSMDPSKRPKDFAEIQQELPPYELVKKALESEKNSSSTAGFGQSSFAGVQSNSKQEYQNYVAKSQWENNWSKDPQVAQQATVVSKIQTLPTATAVQQSVVRVPVTTGPVIPARITSITGGDISYRAPKSNFLRSDLNSYSSTTVFQDRPSSISRKVTTSTVGQPIVFVGENQIRAVSQGRRTVGDSNSASKASSSTVTYSRPTEGSLQKSYTSLSNAITSQPKVEQQTKTIGSSGVQIRSVN